MYQIIRLDECGALGRDLVGGKAKSLGILIKNGFHVPSGVCLTTSFIKELANENELDIWIDKQLEIMSEKPVNTNKILQLIRERVINSSISNLALDRLLKVYNEIALHGTVVVRSSSPGEDNELQSFAGVYHSAINIDSFENFIKNIKICWASLFTEKSYYYHKGKLSKEIAIIVQSFVNPDYSGVLFSCDPFNGGETPVLEYCEGHNEGLTDGSGSGHVVILSEQQVVMGKSSSFFISLCNSLKAIYGCDVDIEWAIEDNVLFLLQVRPVTTLVNNTISYKLAKQEELDIMYKLELGKCKDLFARQLQKKIWFRQYCIQHSIPIPQILYLIYSAEDVDLAEKTIKDVVNSNFVRINWGDGMKLCQTNEIKKHLMECIKQNVNPINDRFHCIQIFEAIEAEKAGFSSFTSNNQVIIEAFPFDIWGLKGGRLEPSSYLVSENGEIISAKTTMCNRIGVLDDENYWKVLECEPFELTLDPATVITINDYTKRLTNLGDVSVEWLIYNGIVFIKDLSIEDNTIPVNGSELKCISSGYAVGQAFVVDDIHKFDRIAEIEKISVVDYNLGHNPVFDYDPIDEIIQLTSLNSNGVIIIAEYPSTGLVPLIPYVKGFLFERGALLCHAAIVLRENQVPAYIVPGISGKLENGNRVVIGEGIIEYMGKTEVV